MGSESGVQAVSSERKRERPEDGTIEENEDVNETLPMQNETENRYAKKPTNIVTPIKASSSEDSLVFSPELLKMYYARLFPFDLLHTWLSYDDTSTVNTKAQFPRREFSFTIEPSPGEEVYIRYQSFSGKDELMQAILKRRPVKIDIGAVFSSPPKDHNSVDKTKFVTQQRELVFDIDLTDYDEVRLCGCSGAKICGKCWKMMTMAVRVMDMGLREDFGFNHIAWFYSGRRGVHAWICDESARTLTNEARSAVASYFEVSLGTVKNKSVGMAHPLHPTLARAMRILEPMFIRDILPASGHGLLTTNENRRKLLATLPPAASDVKELLTRRWDKEDDDSNDENGPKEKWELIKRLLGKCLEKIQKDKRTKTHSSTERAALENWPVQVVFRYTYPRLDINVSKMQNHLLKSPFCVHPKTGRVCVPLNVKEVDRFDPMQVPTLPQLMRELDAFDGQEVVKDEWTKTSLKESFGHFVKDFLEPMKKEMRRQQRDSQERAAAKSGDF